MNYSKALWLVFSLTVLTAMFVTLGASPAPQKESSLEKLTLANNEFSFKLFQQLSSTSRENVFISPLSIHLALGMTSRGARGETKRQMEKVLEVGDLKKGKVAEASRKLLDKFKGLSDVDLSIANSIWARKGLPFKEDFLKTGEKYYGAKLTELDFSSPQALERINGWVAEKTKGKIKKIVKKLNPLDVMVLLNTICFKGKWQEVFKKEYTTERPFFLADGSKKQHPLMSRSGYFSYLKTKKAQIVRLPYGEEGKVAAYVVLPTKEYGLQELVSNLSRKKWRNWISGMKRTHGRLSLPRFELRYGKGLNEPLKTMGMNLAFDKNQADFSGIIEVTGQNAYLSEVRHKTYLKVNETGTEAAAATEVKIGLTSAAPPDETFELVVDRPFLFAIAEEETDTLLFLGGIWNPKRINHNSDRNSEPDKPSESSQDSNRDKPTDTFQESPTTKGICEDTAYTLNQGEWKIGNLSLPGSVSQWKCAYLKYGLTEDLQVGTTLPQNFLGQPNLSGKYHLTSNGPGGSDLAMPARLNISLSPVANLSLSSGLVASWDLNNKFGFHSGANIWFNTSGNFSPFAYVMTDYNVLSNTKLISELKFYPSSQDVLSLRAGGLIKPLDFINIKLSSSIDIPSGNMSAWASLFVRF